MRLIKAEVFDPLSPSEPLNSFAADILMNCTVQLGLPTSSDDVLHVKPGCRAVILAMLEVNDPSNVPELVQHRLTCAFGEGESETLLTSEGGRIHVSNQNPIVIGPPVRGKYWIALNTFDYGKFGHRGAIRAHHEDGRAVNIQAFAVDFLKMNPNGKTGIGEESNESWLCFGQEVLAVADGMVVNVRDGISENQPGQRPKLSGADSPGNRVYIAIGGGHFVFYAHLKNGSIRVKEGDLVKKGDVIGLIGNTGRSDGPHLHFHLADANAEYSQSLPFLFEQYEYYGKRSFEQIIEEMDWEIKEHGHREHESPMNGDILGF
jgi:hypothetical protein